MQKQEIAHSKIEHLLFELGCCVNDLSRYRLMINRSNIQQAEMSLHKLEGLISFIRMFILKRFPC